jgi:hypothetical protein
LAVGFGKSLSRARGPKGKQALAALLVLTVLVCHGAYGAMHQVMAGPDPAVRGHALGAPGGDHGGGLAHHVAALLFPKPLMAHAGDGGSAGVLAYAASLIFFSAALLWLPRGIRARWWARPPAASPLRLGPRATGRCPPPLGIHVLLVLRL